MKRLFTLTLVIILVLSLGVTAMAAVYTGTVDPVNALLINAGTGEILYAKNEEAQAYSAGLVKLMTAYVTVKSIEDLDTVVTVSSSAFSSLNPDSDITLYPQLSGGEQITVRDLLGGMLVASSNDAALALAQYVGGSVSGFVDLMNQHAEELGMSGTVYSNPTGKHYSGQYTTASDIAKLVTEILKCPDLMNIFSVVSYTIPATNKASERTAYNTNRLICEYADEDSYLYENATGMIAGYTSSSAGCLAATAAKDGTELICIILGDTSTGRTERWSLAADLFDYGFGLYAPLPASEVLAEIPLTYTAADGTEYTATPDFTDITVDADTADGITATVTTEDGLTGIATYTNANGSTVAEVPVTLTAEVQEEEPEPEVPEAPAEKPEESAEEPAENTGKSSTNLIIAIALSVIVLAAAAFGASLAAKTKNKGRHISESDSFRVKFRQNFMTYLLFGIIAIVLIIVIFIILI